jgi:hypothetical protein
VEERVSATEERNDPGEAQLSAELLRLQDEVTTLREILEHRAVIEQAKGVLVGTMNIDPEAAFELLVKQSQHTNVKLREVAQSIVDDASRRAQVGRPTSSGSPSTNISIV